MRKLILISLVVLIACTLAFGDKKKIPVEATAAAALKTGAYTPIKYFTSSGDVTDTYVSDLKVWFGTVQPTTASGYGIDISSAGFTDIKTVSILPVKNTANANDMPDVAIKTLTNSMLTVNIRQSNTAVVQILGINVLSGAPMLFPASVADIQLIVRVTGK